LYPQLGRYLAEIRLPAGEDVRIERTRGRGHHTLWADPEALRASVIRVVLV
jgi:hypothetical protein